MNEVMNAYLGIITKPGSNNTVMETLLDRFPDIGGVRPFETKGPYSMVIKVNAENEKELRDKFIILKDRMSQNVIIL